MARPIRPIAIRYTRSTINQPSGVPVVSARIRWTPRYSGVAWTTACSAGRIRGDRIERAGEQEHRHEDQLQEVEVLPAGGRRSLPPCPAPAKPKPTTIAAGKSEQPQRRAEQPEPGQAEDSDDHQEADRVQAATQQRPQDLAHGNVGQRHRRGDDRVVELGVLELVEEVVGGLVDGPVHRRRGQQRRRHEDRVRDAPAVVERYVADQRAYSEAHREQVEERLEEPREDDQEGPPVDEQVPLDQARGAGRDERSRDAQYGHLDLQPASEGDPAGEDARRPQMPPGRPREPGTPRGSIWPSDSDRATATPW